MDANFGVTVAQTLCRKRSLEDALANGVTPQERAFGTTRLIFVPAGQDTMIGSGGIMVLARERVCVLWTQ